MANARVYTDGNIAANNRVMAGWLNPVNTVVFTLFGNGSEYTGNGNLPGTLAVAGNVTLAQKLDVTGNTTVGNLSVTGAFSPSGNQSFGNVLVTGQLSVAGNASVSGNESVTGQMTIGGNTVVGGTIGGYPLMLSPTKTNLAANVSMSSSAFFNGPTLNQGSSGMWYFSGGVTLVDPSGGAGFAAKLWDGVTVIASGAVQSPAAGDAVMIGLSGNLNAPAGNVLISCKTTGSANSIIAFNISGAGKDSHLTGIKIG